MLMMTDQKNLQNIQRIDGMATRIVLHCTQAALYDFDKAENKWRDTEAMGPLFVYERGNYPPYAVMIANRQSLKDYVEPILDSLMLKYDPPYILIHGEDGSIRGIWVYGEDECKKIYDTITSLQKDKKEIAKKTERDMLKAEFEHKIAETFGSVTAHEQHKPTCSSNIKAIDTIFNIASASTFAATSSGSGSKAKPGTGTVMPMTRGKDRTFVETKSPPNIEAPKTSSTLVHNAPKTILGMGSAASKLLGMTPTSVHTFANYKATTPASTLVSKENKAPTPPDPEGEEKRQRPTTSPVMRLLAAQAQKSRQQTVGDNANGADEGQGQGRSSASNLAMTTAAALNYPHHSSLMKSESSGELQRIKTLEEIVLGLIRRIDPFACDLVTYIPSAVLYEFDQVEKQWMKTDTDGPLIVFKRIDKPLYSMLIADAKMKDDFIQPLTEGGLKLHDRPPFIFISGRPDKLIYGIWMRSQQECATIYATLVHLMLSQQKMTTARGPKKNRGGANDSSSSDDL